MANPTLQANFSANTAGFTQGVSVLRQKLTELNTQMEQNKQEIKTANTEIKNYRKELEQLKKDTNNGATATAEQSRRMQELRDGIATATARLGTLRTTEQDLRRSINSTNEELRNQRSAVEEVKDSAATMGDVLKASLYSSAIQTALSKLTTSLKSAAEFCYNVGSSFEAAMSQVEAISGAAGDELDKLTEKAKQLGETTRFSATEAAQAMNYMAMAGWDAQQMLDGIDGVLSLAAASGGDLAETADIVTDAITAFGLKAKDVGHFSNVLAAASANANTNVSMMGETFKYCAPIAGALGFSIEDVSEAIGLMANSGIKSTMAGTALRTTLTKLSEGVTITGQKLGEVEIQTSNADGSMRSLKEILTDLRAAFSQLTEAEKASTAEDIAGKNAMSGFLALMNARAADVNKLRTAIENCNNSSAEMAETMTNNTAGAVTIMKSAMESAGIAVYEKFGEKIRSSVEGITDIFTDLTKRIENGELDAVFERVAQSVGNASEQLISFAGETLPGAIEWVANLISTLVDFREEIGAAVTAVVTLKTAMAFKELITEAIPLFKGLISVIAKLGAVIATNPIGAVAAAVSVLVGGVVALTSAMDDCNERMATLTDQSKQLTQSSEEYQRKTKDLEDVKKRYDKIKNSTDDAITKEAELKALQEELNSQFGDLAGSIDLVAMSYDNVIEKMDTVIKKTSKMSLQDAQVAYQEALDAESQSTAISLDPMFLNLEATEANTYFKNEAYKFGRSGYLNAFTGGNIYFDGSYEKRIGELNTLYTRMRDKYLETGIDDYNVIAKRIKEQVTILEDGLKQRETARKNLNSFTQNTGDGLTKEQRLAGSVGYGVYGNTKAWNDYIYEKTGTAGAAGETLPYDDTNYDSSKSYYKYLLDTEQINAAEYWNTIEQLRDKFYKEDSEEWRDITAEIYKGRKSAAGGSGGSTKTQQELNEEQYTSEKAYQKWRLDMGYITEEEYYDRIGKLRDKYLEEGSEKWRAATLEIHKYEENEARKSLDKLEDMYNGAINAIDEEIKQRDREQEDEDLQKQIDEVDKQLQYGRLDDFSRQQLEQKKQELLDEKSDIEWRRSKEDEKDLMEQVFTMAQDAYEESSANLNDILRTSAVLFGAISNGADQMSSVVNTVINNNSMSFALSAVSQTAEQIAAAVVKKISSSI